MSHGFFFKDLGLSVCSLCAVSHSNYARISNTETIYVFDCRESVIVCQKLKLIQRSNFYLQNAHLLLIDQTHHCYD